GKDPERLIEDMIEYYRDILLHKNMGQITNEDLGHIHNIEEFSSIANLYKEEYIFDIIHQLNRTQTEMKFTNHPIIFMEVCFVQLCQLINDTSEDMNEIARLKEEIKELREELQQIKELGIPERAASGQVEEKREVKTARTSKGNFKVPIGKVENVLSNATKQNLQ